MAAREQRTRMARVLIFQRFFTVCIIPSNKSDRRLPALSLLSFSFSYTYIYINTQSLYRCGPHCDMGIWLVKESCITLPHGCRDTHLHHHVCNYWFYLCVCISGHTQTHTNTERFQKEGICFKAQVVRQQMWATRSHKYQRLECISMKNILHQIVSHCLHVPSSTSCVKTSVQPQNTTRILPVRFKWYK